MVAKKSVRGRAVAKPSKPRKDYPLFAHGSGQWAKKVRGRLFYFGVWDDPTAAELTWERDKEAILAGRDPRDGTVGDTVSWLCDAFLESKHLAKESGELTRRAFSDYHRVCREIAAYFGHGRKLASITAMDLERYRSTLNSSWGPVTINNHLRLARVLFKYGNDIDVLEGRQIPYKIGLRAVSAAKVRKAAAARPAKEFTAGEIHRLLKHASQPLKAFILLGINCGYGSADIGRLKTASIDFPGQWLGEVRGKTGIARGAWLWPETVIALQEAIEQRPSGEREEHSGLAFLTRSRLPWNVDGSTSKPLALAFGRLKAVAGIERTGVGHYSLRHTFATVAGDYRDQPAVDYVMGHCDQSIRAVYREGIDPARVKAVCEHVRNWWLAGG